VVGRKRPEHRDPDPFVIGPHRLQAGEDLGGLRPGNQAGDPAGAVAWYQRALEGPGADVPLLVKTADAQLRSGAADAARSTIEKALEKDPFSREARAVLRRIK
jgi:hypothetical protein